MLILRLCLHRSIWSPHYMENPALAKPVAFVCLSFWRLQNVSLATAGARRMFGDWQTLFFDIEIVFKHGSGFK